MDNYVPVVLSGYLLATIVLASIILATFGMVLGLLYRLLCPGSATASPGLSGRTIMVEWLRLIGFTFPIGFTAYVAGYLATMSRTTAIGTVLPAVLALIGGLNIYVFGSETRYRALVSYCVCAFVLMLFYGAEYGGYLRDATRQTRLQELAVQELKIRTLRRNLGLPDEFPAWVVSAEPK